MTLPEIDLICRHDPEGKSKKKGPRKPPLFGQVEWALHLLKEQMGRSPMEKIEDRLRERNGR